MFNDRGGGQVRREGAEYQIKLNLVGISGQIVSSISKPIAVITI